VVIDLAQSYRDVRLGIEGAFLQPELAGDRTVAVLSSPLDRREGRHK